MLRSNSSHPKFPSKVLSDARSGAYAECSSSLKNPNSKICAWAEVVLQRFDKKGMMVSDKVAEVGRRYKWPLPKRLD